MNRPNPVTLGSHEFGHCLADVPLARKHRLTLTGTITTERDCWTSRTNILDRLPGDKINGEMIIPMLLVGFAGGSLGEHCASNSHLTLAELRQRCMVKWLQGDFWTDLSGSDQREFDALAEAMPSKELNRVVLRGIIDTVPIIHTALRSDPLKAKRIGEILLDQPVGGRFEVPLV